jgi:hypothetical protein
MRWRTVSGAPASPASCLKEAEPVTRNPTQISAKRALAALGAAALLGVGAAGVAGAQTPPATTTPTPRAGAPATSSSQQFLDALAARLGIPADRLKQAIDEIRQSLGIPDRGDRSGLPGPLGGRGGDFDRGGFGASLSVAAQAIGITADQLRQELPGKSLADVARAHNVDPARVATALKTDAAARVDQAVQAGRVAADQAATLKQQANTRIDQQMTQQTPAAGSRGAAPGPRDGGGRGGRSSPSASSTAPATAGA